MAERELNFEGKSPLLYLIATPIGNRSEFSPRAIELCKEADFIGAEDTRNSRAFLLSYGIDKPFISCHEHNEEEAGEKIVSLLKEGKKICYMSDAGYPAISDPGERLVRRCIENGIKVSTVSGPNAGLNALAASGLPTDHFYFEGFLPSKPSERKKELEELKGRKETIIFYESPHRIEKTLKDMAEVLGDRKACLARELTKSHEEFIRAGLEDLAALDPATLRGEMVIIVEGAKETKKGLEEEDILLLLKNALNEGLKSKEAISKVAKDNNLPKNAVYDLYLKHFK